MVNAIRWSLSSAQSKFNGNVRGRHKAQDTLWDEAFPLYFDHYELSAACNKKVRQLKT